MADIIAVSALNKYVRSILESDPVLTDIAVRGEISNFVRNHKTGHCYFSLKDDKAAVKAVMFRLEAQGLAFAPENGMQVVARGRISLYERDGAFQIYAEHLFLDGAGAAQQAFLQLKERLEKDGLFDAARKKNLPPWPKKIGLVTSKTGAALQDILNVAARRYPLVSFVLAPVTVQGQAAVPGIVRAVQVLDGLPGIDLIIVARGGGAAEDLWVFNAEALARAVFACTTPVVSAIGHETDHTILDFVADLRAPTPSAAAELALPDIADVRHSLLNIMMNIANKIHFKRDLCYNEVENRVCRAQSCSPAGAVLAARERLTAATALAGRLAQQKLAARRQRFGAAAALAEGLNPYAVLARGYGAVARQGRLVRSVKDCVPGDSIQITLRDGSIEATANNVTEGR